MWREVDPPSKPPCPIVQGEVADIHVNDRHMGIARVQDARYTRRGETGCRGIQLLGECRGHGALNRREVEASFLNDLALFEDTGVTSSSIGTLPFVAGEQRLVVERHQRRHLIVLDRAVGLLDLRQEFKVHHQYGEVDASEPC